MRRCSRSLLASAALAAFSVLLPSCAVPPSQSQESAPPAGAALATPLQGVTAGPQSVPSAKEAEPPAPAAPEGPMTVSVEEAVLLALENNRALRVERLNPDVKRTLEEQQRAVFDPVFSAEMSASHDEAETAAGGGTFTDSTDVGANLSKSFPAGTKVGVDLTSDGVRGTTAPDQHATRAGVSVTQALLQGAGEGPNLAGLRQARLDTQMSEYELRGFAEALVAQVESTYWDYVLARRQIEIFEESLKLAQQQLDETQQRIRVGTLPETELAAAQAEIALRREALINARSRSATLRVQLLRLVKPGALAARGQEVTPQSQPVAPAPDNDAVENHLAVALKMRPDLNQARLLVQRGELELVKTKNGLLPRMDLFVSMGKTGYADSFGGSTRDITSDGHDVSAGVSFQLPLGNRAAVSRHRQAGLTQAQSQESLTNLQDLVRADIESACIEVQRTSQQVDATAATRRFQEEKVRSETAKFQVGKSTAILVAAAQNDLVASQVAEVEAVTNCLKAATDLYRLEGSLLERRGVAAPGRSGPP